MSRAARFRYTMVAGATAVVIGTGFTVIGLSRHAEAETSTTATGGQAPLGAAPAAAGVRGRLAPARAPAAPPAELPTSPPAPTKSVSPTPKKTTVAPTPKK